MGVRTQRRIRRGDRQQCPGWLRVVIFCRARCVLSVLVLTSCSTLATRRDLARRTHSTENDYVGAPTGGMDQIASLLCTEGHAILYDVQAGTTQQVPFDPAGVGLVVLAIDSMVRHGHADGAYRERRSDCEESARILGVDTLRQVSVADLPPRSQSWVTSGWPNEPGTLSPRTSVFSTPRRRWGKGGGPRLASCQRGARFLPRRF